MVENHQVERSRELLTLVALTVMVSSTEDERSVKTDVDRHTSGSGRSALGALAC